MKTIAQILDNQTSGLAKLLAKAEITRRMDLMWKKNLDPDLARHCNFAKITKETLVATVDNAAWATRLRYAIQDILKNIQTQTEFQMVKKIRYVIRPEIATGEEPEKSQLKKPKISPESEKLWRETLRGLH